MERKDARKANFRKPKRLNVSAVVKRVTDTIIRRDHGGISKILRTGILQAQKKALTTELSKQDRNPSLSVYEFNACIKTLHNGKSLGADGISFEMYKASKASMDKLFSHLQQVE